MIESVWKNDFYGAGVCKAARQYFSLTHALYSPRPFPHSSPAAPMPASFSAGLALPWKPSFPQLKAPNIGSHSTIVLT